MDSSLRLKSLRAVLVADALVLVILGVLLIIAPEQMFGWFGMQGMPPGAYYLVGMWGALMATMGLGYALASGRPGASQAWVMTGIIRAVLEVGVSAAYIAGGTVNLRNSGLGMSLALFFAIAYLALYPRSGDEQAALEPRSRRGQAGE